MDFKVNINVNIGFKENKTNILSNNNFIKTFSLRENDKYWNSVVFVQANVKSKIGIGNKIPFLFIYDMELSQQENEDSNRQQNRDSSCKNNYRSIESMNPKNSMPLKEYEDINYLENQTEDLSGLDRQEM